MTSVADRSTDEGLTEALGRPGDDETYVVGHLEDMPGIRDRALGDQTQQG